MRKRCSGRTRPTKHDGTKTRPALHIFQVARMDVKVPVLSSPPSKNPNHRSSLIPGCYRQRAVRRVKKVSSQRGTRVIAPQPTTRCECQRWSSRRESNPSGEQRASSSSSSRMSLASWQPLLQQMFHTTFEILDDESFGSVLLFAAKTWRNIHLARGVARPSCTRLFCPLPP